MTDQEILKLMARILGGNIDTGEGLDTFISSGPGGNRTVLEGDERRITRAINLINNLLGFIDAGVIGFDERFSNVIGREVSDDADEFAKIGTNLIQAVSDLKEKINQNGSGIPPEVLEEIENVIIRMEEVEIELQRLDNTKEDILNKVEVSIDSTSIQYANAKSVWDLMQLMIATIPAGGLRIPIKIDLESDLPDPTTLEPGYYFFIQDMDETAPERTGRVWTNYTDPNDETSSVKYYRVFDQWNSPDGESIVLTTTGTIEVSKKWLDSILEGFTAKGHVIFDEIPDDLSDIPDGSLVFVRTEVEENGSNGSGGLVNLPIRQNGNLVGNAKELNFIGVNTSVDITNNRGNIEVVIGNILDSTFPVGFQIVTGWIDDVVVDSIDGIWLKMNGQIFDPEIYPDLIGTSAVMPNIKESIPNMTAENYPSGFKATASSRFTTGTGYYPWHAFNNGDSESMSWVSQVGTFSGGIGSQWLQIELPEMIYLNSYSLTSWNNVPHDVAFVRDFEIQGWSDTLNEWIIIDDRDNISSNFPLDYKYFTISNIKEEAFKIIRILITKNWGHNYVAIQKFQIFEIIFGIRVLNIPKINGQYTYVKAR